MDVPVASGTVTILKFGQEDEGGYIMLDTGQVPKGTRIRGEIIGYTEVKKASMGSTAGPNGAEPNRSVPAEPVTTSSGDKSPAIGTIVQGTGSALSVNQTGGITAGTVNLNGLPHQPPDLELSFFVEKELRFNFINNTAATAHNPKYWFAIEDYTHPVLRDDKVSTLPILTRVINDFVRPHSFQGNIEVLNLESEQHVKQGDRLFGLGAITCDECLGTRNYWLYYEVGGGGWYSPIEPGTSGMPFFDRKPPSDRAIDDALDALVAKQYRIPMLRP